MSYREAVKQAQVALGADGTEIDSTRVHTAATYLVHALVLRLTGTGRGGRLMSPGSMTSRNLQAVIAELAAAGCGEDIDGVREQVAKLAKFS